jgi:hypothetical protein
LDVVVEIPRILGIGRIHVSIYLSQLRRDLDLSQCMPTRLVYVT